MLLRCEAYGGGGLLLSTIWRCVISFTFRQLCTLLQGRKAPLYGGVLFVSRSGLPQPRKAPVVPTGYNFLPAVLLFSVFILLFLLFRLITRVYLAMVTENKSVPLPGIEPRPPGSLPNNYYLFETQTRLLWLPNLLRASLFPVYLSCHPFTAQHLIVQCYTFQQPQNMHVIEEHRFLTRFSEIQKRFKWYFCPDVSPVPQQSHRILSYCPTVARSAFHWVSSAKLDLYCSLECLNLCWDMLPTRGSQQQ
jgi:hypothetical protein